MTKVARPSSALALLERSLAEFGEIPLDVAQNFDDETLGAAARFSAFAEDHADSIRVAVGAALTARRDGFAHGEWGGWLAGVAAEIGRSPDSLERWMREAQRHYGLQPPKGAHSDRGISSSARRAEDGPAATPEKVTPSEVIPPSEPERDKRANEISRKVTPAPRHEQLALPLEEASLAIESAPLDELVALAPARLEAMAARISEAQRAQRRLTGRAAAPVCDHPKAMHKTLPYGTICDKARGGCGIKIR